MFGSIMKKKKKCLKGPSKTIMNKKQSYYLKWFNGFQTKHKNQRKKKKKLKLNARYKIGTFDFDFETMN